VILPVLTPLQIVKDFLRTKHKIFFKMKKSPQKISAPP